MLKLIRRLFSRAVSLSLLRRSSLVRRLFSLTLSRSLSICSSVKFRLLSLLLFCSLSRCSSVKLRLSSLFLSLSRFLCLSLSLYSKLEDIINKISRIAELRGAQPIRKISFSSELTSLKFSVVYASRNAGGPLFSRQKLCTHRLPEILHWFACGADGRSVGRSVGHVITKFLRWVDLFTHGAPRARFARGALLIIMIILVLINYHKKLFQNPLMHFF